MIQEKHQNTLPIRSGLAGVAGELLAAEVTTAGQLRDNGMLDSRSDRG